MKTVSGKALVSLWLSLLLFSCKEDNLNPINTPANPGREQVPVEVIKTASASSATTTLKFTYNAAGQLTREDVYSNNVPQGYTVYSYKAGKLWLKKIYDKTGQAKEQEEYVYNAENLPEKLKHSYITTAGIDTLHHYRTYAYTPDGKIAETREFTPTGKSMNRHAYTFVNEATLRLQVYDGNNRPNYTHEYTYDNRKNPFAATNTLMVNFPGNVTREVATDSLGTVVVSNTSALTYSEAGYPIQITKTAADGSTRTEKYAYQPK